MADTPESNGNGAEQPAIQQRVLAQYVRDLSFENVMAQKGVQGEVSPEVSVRVNLDARKRGQDDQFEVLTKLNIESKNKAGNNEPLFVMELEYAGVFELKNVPEDQLHPYLMIECPRLLFPYLRRIVSDVTRDGGFPPLNMETIDFVQLYRQEIMRRAAAQQEGETAN